MGPRVVLRTLTYNIHRWRGHDGQIDVARTAHIIQSSAADIVTLNEVLHPLDMPGHTLTALPLLAAQLDMNFIFTPTIHPGPFDQPSTAYGNALLTRLPILAYANHRLTTPPAHEPRGLFEARLLLPDGQVLTVYGTHLDHKRETVRVGQVQALLQWTVRDRGRAHLLMGDFNSVAPADFDGNPAGLAQLANHPAMARLVDEGLQVLPRLLKAGYTDCFAQAGVGAAPTFATDDERARIDYCFAAGPLAHALVACQRIGDASAALGALVRAASDHFPLLTTFAWPA